MLFYSDCADGTGLQRVERQNSDGAVRLCAQDERLLLVVSGEPPGTALLDCFEAARTQGWLRHSMRTLVDMRRFVGIVDWQSINQVRQMADWGDDEGRTRTAYLIRNDGFMPLVKIASTLFRCCQHRAFTDHDVAVAWLDG